MMMESKDKFMANLEFTGLIHQCQNLADVRISVGRSKGTERLYVTFNSADVHNKIGVGDRVKVARYKNRLIIIKAPDGVKIAKDGKVATFTITPKFENLKYFIGDYDLKYDEFYEYYYIEKVV